MNGILLRRASRAELSFVAIPHGALRLVYEREKERRREPDEPAGYERADVPTLAVSSGVRALQPLGRVAGGGGAVLGGLGVPGVGERVHAPAGPPPALTVGRLPMVPGHEGAALSAPQGRDEAQLCYGRLPVRFPLRQSHEPLLSVSNGQAGSQSGRAAAHGYCGTESKESIATQVSLGRFAS